MRRVETRVVVKEIAAFSDGEGDESNIGMGEAGKDGGVIGGREIIKNGGDDLWSGRW